jgi:hypothetical protein
MVDVLVGPSSIALAPGHDGVEAYVRESRFLGQQQRLTLAVAGREEPVIAILDRSALVAQGGTHRFVMDAASVHIFKKP